MKSFLNRTLVFFTVVGIYLLINIAINYHRLKDPIVLDEKTLIIGDSHLMSSVDPSMMQNTANICSGAESYIMTFYKLKKILRDNPQITTIYLGFSYNNFSAYQDLRLSGSRAKSQFSRYYEILPFNLPFHVSLNNSKFYHTFVRELALYPNLSENKYMGGFQKHEPGLKKANVTETIQKHFYPQKDFVGISKYATVYLDSIINLSNNNGIELTLVSSPLHQEYRNQTPVEIKNYFDSVKTQIEARKIRVFDFIEHPYEDNLFKDYDHLSYEGAKHFTIMIKENNSSK